MLQLYASSHGGKSPRDEKEWLLFVQHTLKAKLGDVNAEHQGVTLNDIDENLIK